MTALAIDTASILSPLDTHVSAISVTPALDVPISMSVIRLQPARSWPTVLTLMDRSSARASLAIPGLLQPFALTLMSAQLNPAQPIPSVSIPLALSHVSATRATLVLMRPVWM